jgi:hypothetical protein
VPRACGRGAPRSPRSPLRLGLRKLLEQLDVPRPLQALRALDVDRLDLAGDVVAAAVQKLHPLTVLMRALLGPSARPRGGVFDALDVVIDLVAHPIERVQGADDLVALLFDLGSRASQEDLAVDAFLLLACLEAVDVIAAQERGPSAISTWIPKPRARPMKYSAFGRCSPYSLVAARSMP